MISSGEGQGEIEEKGVGGEGGAAKRRDVEGQKMEREERRSKRSGEGAGQKRLRHSIWILLAAVGKI